MASPSLQVDKKKFKMLLLGETGVGKSSLVAFIRNYAKQRGPRFDKKVEAFGVEKEVGQMTSQTRSSATYEIKFMASIFDLTVLLCWIIHFVHG